ncbi:MAG: anti-sigma factor [Chitinophagaceae bacterium]|nr:anti-sigma factor [Rubrivivax sp.]
MSTSVDPERSASAGEYVLGTLSPAERKAFEASLATDTTLQAEVYGWQDRLLGLAQRVPPVEPAAAGWASISAAISDKTAAGSNGPVPANDALWQRLRRWQFASAVGLAASVLLAAVLVLRGPLQAQDGARFLAVLQAPGDQRTGWLVEATVGGQVRLIPVAGAEPVPAGKALQFWTKGEGEAGPTSLGLVPNDRPTTVPASRLRSLGARQLFELTLEPETGSPLGRPTGPILYVGRAVAM